MRAESVNAVARDNSGDKIMDRNWLNTLDIVGQSPLMRASQTGRTDVTTMLLLSDANDEPRNFGDLPVLHRAACWGFDDVVNDLIQEGADPDEMDSQGETALHKAARLGNLEAAQALIENDADVSLADSLGMTALHWAALTGSLPMVDLLLSHGANVDARDYYAGGITPRQIARMMGHTEIVEMMQNRYAIF